MKKKLELACSLTSSEFLERKNQLEKEIFSRIELMEEVDNGYLFHFQDVEDMLPNLFHYILAEKECCPLLQQDITIKSNCGGLLWKVSGKHEVKEMLDQMISEMEFPEP